eukprot:gene11642-13527_t
MSIDTDCYEQITLFLRAYSLPKIGTFSPTCDAFAVIFRVDSHTKALSPEGFTEILKDNVDPDWLTTFTVNYHFELVQEFVIRVYCSDGRSKQQDLDNHTLLGETRAILSNLMCASNQLLCSDLTGGRETGRLEVRGEANHHTRDNLVVTFACNKLSNKEGFFGTSNPFLKLHRCNEDGSYTSVWQNKHIDSSLNPRWSQVKIPLALVCNGDIDRPLRVEVLDWDKSGKHVYMGQVDTSVRQLMASNGAALNVIDTAKKAKKGDKYLNSGTLHASYCYIEENPTFSDFIAGGMQINLVVAIDFTASNGDPLSLDSLHYSSPDPRHRNPYQEAITSVCSVLDAYDTDKIYPVYGFGAKVRDSSASNKYTVVQHCFPVYGGGLEVHGVDGILQAYKDCLSNVMLSGPTLFSPIIKATHAIVNKEEFSQEKQHYTILLIITDGTINDFDNTKEAIIEASSDPMSIIIIGVGEADFSQMHQLDSDNTLLTHNRKTATRDIVQFVSYKDEILKGHSAVAEAVLAEIPGQVLLFMQQNNYKPNPSQTTETH